MNFPEINFATADVAELQKTAVALVENLLGRELGRADPLRVFLNSLLAIIVQQRLLIDHAAKMNLLSYATGDYLDNLGLLVGVTRLPASKAAATVTLKLSAARNLPTTILYGTRVTSDNKIFFALDETVIFAAGETEKESKVVCTAAGEEGNGFAVGELNKIVDPRPYLASIVNTTETEGGSDREDDDAFRQRIHEAPESYSVAGSIGAYKFHAKSASAQIADVAVESPQPGYVNVYVLLKGGRVPSDEFLKTVADYLNADKVRPLTDFVNVYAPEKVSVSLHGVYYIAREDQTQAEQIIARAEKAIDEYIEWQRSALGRDINPDELIYRMKAAGVKRVEIDDLSYRRINNSQVAVITYTDLRYSGLEAR